MKTVTRFSRVVSVAACMVSILILTTTLLNADDRPEARATALRANAAVTATLVPTADPTFFTCTANGVVQNLPLGTSVETVELEIRFPTAPDQPVLINGTGSFTSLDGANSLRFTVSGAATPDPANPAFFNSKYKITFTGGTGVYASTRGQGEINEVVMFTSPLTGTAVWTLKGFIMTR